MVLASHSTFSDNAVHFELEGMKSDWTSPPPHSTHCQFCPNQFSATLKQSMILLVSRQPLGLTKTIEAALNKWLLAKEDVEVKVQCATEVKLEAMLVPVLRGRSRLAIGIACFASP